MAISFDGEALIITLPAPTDGVLEIDAEPDLYSEWKVWVKTSDNVKYPLAFGTSGGEALVGALTAGSYFQLRNDLGWRIRPYEEDHTVYVTGNLVPADSSLPMMTPTTGAYTVGVFGIQPITQTVEVPAGQDDAMTLAQFRAAFLALK